MPARSFFKTLAGALILAPGMLHGTARSEAEARAIATRILPAVAPQRTAAPSLYLSDDTEAAYYIFNAPANEGFVVVSGDDRLPEVLGYSDTGYLNTSEAPEALLFMLEMSTKAVDNNGIVTVSPQPGTPVVAPLLGGINWGQGDPYNSLCPTLAGGQRGYVGCVATAMTQIMRYYKYPVQGAGTHSYLFGGKTLTADFGSTTYDWDNMPEAMPADYTVAQADAVSTLCYHAGVAVDMLYEAAGSGAYSHLVSGALRDYFKYSPSTRMHSRSYYNTAQWMDLITDELDAGRPVYYAASSEDGLGGHAFVCDGYDDGGYVHINWGWYGSSNGYFYINHLNPGELGTGGGSGAYNLQQEIITGFAPPAADDKAEMSIYSPTRFSCDSFGDDMTIMCYLENLDTHDYTGGIHAVLCNNDDEIVTSLHSAQATVPGFNKGQTGSLLFTLRGIPTSTTVANGKYRVKLAYEDGDGLTALRHYIGLPNYTECTVKNGYIMLDDRHSPVPQVKMTEPLQVLGGEAYAGCTALLTTRLANCSNDFRLSNIVLTLTPMDDPSLPVYTQSYVVNIYDMSEADVTMKISFPEEYTPGRYQMTLAHDKYPDAQFETVDGNPAVLQLSERPAGPVLQLYGDPYFYNSETGDTRIYTRGEKAVFALPLMNYGIDGTCRAAIKLTDTATDKWYIVNAEERTWTNGERHTTTIIQALVNDPGVYTVTPIYYDTYLRAKDIGMQEQFNIEIQEQPDLPLEVVEASLPETMAEGGRYPWSVTVKARRAVRGTFYLRLRQNTNSSGEIVYMTSTLNLAAGATQTFSGNYRPGLTPGAYYYPIIEVKENGVTLPVAGHANFYRQIPYGEFPVEAGIEDVVIDDVTVEYYNLQGIKVEYPTGGLYIRRQGNTSTKVVL